MTDFMTVEQLEAVKAEHVIGPHYCSGFWWDRNGTCLPSLLADTALAALKRADEAEQAEANLRVILAEAARRADEAEKQRDRWQKIAERLDRDVSALTVNLAALDGEQPAAAEAKLVRVNAAMRLLIDSGDATPQAARIIKQIVDQP
jgi:hypothetical protein